MEDMDMKARFAAKVREAGELMVEKCGRSSILKELAHDCANCEKSIQEVFEAVDNGIEEQKIIAGDDLIYKVACVETMLNIVVEYVLTENDRNFYEQVKFLVPDCIKDVVRCGQRDRAEQGRRSGRRE